MRCGFNMFPAYCATGARITYVASDFREVRVKLPLSWQTRNYVGTIFGGSLYGAVDPIYMLMLIRLLGPGYLVWDKAASIRFLLPGRRPLSATFRIEDGELEAIRELLRSQPKVDRSYLVELVDADGVVHAEVEKIVQVRVRDAGRA